MHSVLKAALDSAPEALRAGPHHGGVDANPQLTSFGYCGVAIFMAEACAHHVRDVIEEEERDEWLREAKNIYSRHARAAGKEGRVLSNKELLAARRKIVTEGTSSRKGSLPIVLPIPLRAANLALFAAVDIEAVSNQAYVLMALKTVAGQITGLLRGERVMAFLRDLDRVLVREELRAILAQRRDPRCEKIEACVWRGAGTETRQGRASGAKITHWIGRLADGSFLLMWKVGSHWQIITGERDEILASVSDAHMESAVNALISTRGSAP